MRAQLSNRDYELLSAYIDNQLVPGEKGKLEERLRVYPELKTALDEMMRMHMLLRSAPRRRAPRNFTLTPAMVGESRPRRSWSWNLFPALSFASALATLALVGVFIFQALPGRQQPVQTSALPAEPAAAPAQPDTTARNNLQATQPAAGALPAAEAQPNTAEKSAPSGGEAQPLNPPVVVWGGQVPGVAADSGMATGSGGAGGVGGGGGGGPSVGQLLQPPLATGKGGAGNQVYGLGGGGTSGGNIVLPPQAAESLAAEQTTPTATPAKPDPAISGTGPILGVPPANEGGQITEQKALMGQANPSENDSAAPVVAVERGAPRTLLGLPILITLEILLALIAVATGVAAFFVRRKSA